MAPTYLLKKHQRWWYDRGIPKHLRTPLGKTRFRVNLNTSDQKVAFTLKPKAEALYNLAIDKAQRQLNGTLAPLEQLEDFAKAFREAHSSPVEDGEFSLDVSPDEIDKAESHIEAHLRDHFAELVTGRAPKSLRAFIDEYLASASVKQLEARTLLERKTALNRLVAWCSSNGVLNVLKFTRAHARAFTSSLKGEPPTIIKALQAPTALWRFMQEEGVAVDPTIWKNLAPKKPLREKNEDRQRSFSSAELKTLLCGPASALLKDAMLVALYSGMRLSELGELRVDHVDVARQTILVPGTKTASALRMIPLHPKLSELLKPRMVGKSPRAYVFHELGEDVLKHGRKRSAKLSQAFTRYRESLGVSDDREDKRQSKVNFHSFRHTADTAMIEHQPPIAPHVIDAFFGWSNQGAMRHRYAANADLMNAMRDALKALHWDV